MTPRVTTRTERVVRVPRPRGTAFGAAFAFVALVLLGGCSFFSFLPFVDDPDAGDEEGEPTALQEFQPEAVIERRWQVGVGRGLGRKYLRLKPTILADRVYAADGYGQVVALDRLSGKRLWSATIGEPDSRPFLKVWDRRDPSFVTGGVGAGEGMVLLGTTRGEVIALDADDGSEVWRTHVSSEVLSPPRGGRRRRDGADR